MPEYPRTLIKSGTTTITAESSYVDVTHSIGTVPEWVDPQPTNVYAI